MYKPRTAGLFPPSTLLGFVVLSPHHVRIPTVPPLLSITSKFFFLFLNWETEGTHRVLGFCFAPAIRDIKHVLYFKEAGKRRGGGYIGNLCCSTAWIPYFVSTTSLMLHCEMQIVLGFFSLVPQVRCKKRGTHLLSRFLQPLKSLAIGRTRREERNEEKKKKHTHQTIIVTNRNVSHGVLLQTAHTVSLLIFFSILWYCMWFKTNQMTVSVIMELNATCLHAYQPLNHTGRK